MLPSEKQVDHQCAYEIGGERCRYPGTMSLSTLGEGPWFCRWHFQCESPVMGEKVLQDSRSYRQLDVKGYRNPEADIAAQKAVADANRSAAKFCRERGLETRQQMLEFMQARSVMGSKIAVNQAREPGED